MIGIIGNGFMATRVASACRNLKVDYAIIKRGDPVIGDALINCAGYTGYPNVDDCENHALECVLDNAVLPAQLDSLDKPWVHFSTGCFYHGVCWFSEESQPNFVPGIYQASKLAGEKAIKGDCRVLRIRMPFDFSIDSKNLLVKLYRYERTINAYNSITYAPEAAEIAVKMLMNNAPRGVYHCVNPGPVWTADLVQMMSKEYIELPLEEFKGVPRSACTLNSEKLTRAGYPMTNTRDLLQPSTIRDWLGAMCL